MDEEVTNDKGKIAFLVGIIIVVVILIVALVFITYLDIKSNNAPVNKLSTTSRRNVQINDVTTDDIVDIDEEGTTTSVEATPEDTTAVQTTNVATTTGATQSVQTTTKKSTYVATTKVITSTYTSVYSTSWTIKGYPDEERTVVTDDSTYPDSKNSMEWDIVNFINDARKTNGLPPLKVARELRALAEEGADLMLGHTDDVVKNYLKPHNNWRGLSYNGAISSFDIYKKTKNLGLESNSSLNYIGVGVLYKACGNGCMPTYYYVVVYE